MSRDSLAMTARRTPMVPLLARMDLGSRQYAGAPRPAAVECHPRIPGTRRGDMTKDELKQRVFEAIDRRGDEIIGLGEQIRRQPELGFKEVKTARLVEDTFKKLGLSPRSGLAMTGVRADVGGRGRTSSRARPWARARAS